MPSVTHEAEIQKLLKELHDKELSKKPKLKLVKTDKVE